MKQKLERILVDTTKLDFPIFMGKEKKLQFLIDKKNEYDKQIDCLVSEYEQEPVSNREALWNEAKEYADSEFSGLKEPQRLNGFYLQEIIHKYVELQITRIMGE